jgi:WD40 repeat protein/serine/threonine protein kinase
MPGTHAKRSTAAACPSPEELRALISSDVSGPRLIELTDHVGECDHCRRKMDGIATQELPVLAEAIRGIDKQGIPKNSAYWGVVDEAVVHLTRTRGPDGSRTAKLDPDLKFLQPSNEPGRLGRIGEFDVIRIVGRGGMGVVMHAYDPTLQRDVAIKILDPQLASNDTARQRFLREARAAAAVAHENIVAVHSVNEDNHSGLPFFVMQLVVGESLEQRLRRQGKLDVAETARIGAQAAAGLAAAHATGLIHRDIKPGNILIEEGTERVKLTDFGLARAAEDLKLTKTGFVSGTPLYMAPEQAKGESIDHRADLFSLGVVLYECLAGKPPFDANTPLAVLRRVADDRHDSLKKFNPAIPGWFEDVIDDLLEKSPKHRIATAAELHEQLSAQLPRLSSVSCDPAKASEPCPLSLPSSLSRRDLRRWRIRLAMLMAVPLLLGILAGAGAMAALQSSRPPDVVALPPETVYAEEPVAQYSKLFPNQLGACCSLALTSDGKTLVMGLEDGHILVYDVANERIRVRLKEHTGPVFGVEFFPDDKRFASASDDGSIRIWSLEELRKSQSTMTSPNGVRALAIDRHGLNIATGDRGGTINVWDVKEQVPTHTYEFKASVLSLAFSKDTVGQMLIATGSNGTSRVWNLTDDLEKGSLAGHTGPVYTSGFSTNNELIATGGWDGKIKIWSADNYNELRTLEGHMYDVYSVNFSPCCKMLASAGQDGTVRVWDVESGKEVRKFKAHNPAAHVVRFSQDGKFLFTGGRDGDVRAWATGK